MQPPLQPAAAPERQQKRAQFAEPANHQPSALRWIVAALFFASIPLAYFGLPLLKSSADAPRPTVVAQLDSEQGDLRVPLRDLAASPAKFFELVVANHAPVRFFVVKTTAGDYRASLDACQVCAHAKKGYRVEGADMVCNNCGRHFPVDLIGHSADDGCHPLALTATIEGDSLVIPPSELLAGVKYF